MHWLLAVPVLALGVLLLLMNLFVALVFAWDCLRTRSFKRRSGFPFIGPLLISLGWWISPIAFRAWVFWLPWGLDLFAFLFSYALLRGTGSKPV